MFRPTREGRTLVDVALDEALAQDGCPACWAADRASQRWVGALAYEQVTDVGQRAALRRAGGLCAVHFGGLAAANPGGAAIILADLAAAVTGHLVGGQRPSTSVCPACQVVEAAARRLVEALLTRWDPAVAAHYADSPGLCLWHLAFVPARRGGPLLAADARRWAALAANLAAWTAPGAPPGDVTRALAAARCWHGGHIGVSPDVSTTAGTRPDKGGE